jgi:luciferase family oxidoreductase group 1
MMPFLSVLDFIPVRASQTSADALAVSMSLARTAEGLGYRRYWVAEHHNMAAVASTNTPVLIAMLAGATMRIRIGSGGVLLANHAPLIVAEQFALLEAAFPGRIDLGVGRASGADAVTAAALGRSSGSIEDLGAFLDADGVTVSDGGRSQTLLATPRAASVAPMWLLGSSEASAQLAGQSGLSYVFAHHFGIDGTERALKAYRESFVPSASLTAPRTLLPALASVADTYDEAYAAALPWLLVMLALHTGRAQEPVASIEDAERATLTPADRALVAGMARQYVIGTPDQARAQILELAKRYAVDEVMVNPIGSARAGVDPRADPERERTLRLLVEAGCAS